MGLSAMPTSNAEAGQKNKRNVQSGGPNVIGDLVLPDCAGSLCWYLRFHRSTVLVSGRLRCLGALARKRKRRTARMDACAHKQMSRCYCDNVTRPHVCIER